MIRRLLAGALCVIVSTAYPLRADQDSIEGPWGTIHADLSGTAASLEIQIAGGPFQEAWRFQPADRGLDRTGGRSSIVFDAAGNLYWITLIGGGTNGEARLVSANPADGSIRWEGHEAGGELHVLGSAFSGASPVVGQARVYAIGDSGGDEKYLLLAAYDKASGERLWTADLYPSALPAGGNSALTPALYQGKLYVVGVSENRARDFYRVDAETGNVDWGNTVDKVEIGNISPVPPEVASQVVGQAAFVPDAFGEGIHGLYFNGDGDAPASATHKKGVYGIRIDASGATFGWKDDGGKVGRSHVLYSEVTGRLYTLTWVDYGNSICVYDPMGGLVSCMRNIPAGSGHGFFDVGCVDYDGTIIGGGSEGSIFRYTDDGTGTVTAPVAFKGGTKYNLPFWGEFRNLGALVLDSLGNSILVTGTYSAECCSSHIIAVDVTNQKVLWEHDTGIRETGGSYTFAGGPVVGPDGKVYYFERPTTPGWPVSLVAIGPAAGPVPPTAGFLMAKPSGAGYEGTCIPAGDGVHLDGSCSIGKDLKYTFSVDPPEAAIITQAEPTDSQATLRFLKSGSFPVRLDVENGDGTDDASLNVCVETMAPRAVLTVTDVLGGAIDSVDDADAIPCLPNRETAIADALGSTGGDLTYTFSVDRPADVDIDQGGDEKNPVARMTFWAPGSHRISVTVKNDKSQNATSRVICVKDPASGDRFLRGDCNADLRIDLADAVAVLAALFMGSTPPCIEACNADGDVLIRTADAISVLTFLFKTPDVPLNAPYPACGSDPDPGTLGCATPRC